MLSAIQVRTIAGEERETVERVVADLLRQLGPGELIEATDIRRRLATVECEAGYVCTIVYQFDLGRDEPSVPVQMPMWARNATAPRPQAGPRDVPPPADGARR